MLWATALHYSRCFEPFVAVTALHYSRCFKPFAAVTALNYSRCLNHFVAVTALHYSRCFEPFCRCHGPTLLTMLWAICSCHATPCEHHGLPSLSPHRQSMWGDTDRSPKARSPLNCTPCCQPQGHCSAISICSDTLLARFQQRTFGDSALDS